MTHPLLTERPWWSLLWIADPHVSSVGPMSRRDDYEASIFNKLKQINIIANAVKVDRVICGGDVFHHRSPTKTSHRTIQKLIDLWRDRPLLGIVGNHDLAWNNENFLDRQPLGVLLKAGVYDLIVHPVRVGPFLIAGINFQEEIIAKDRYKIPLDDYTGPFPTIRVLLMHQLANLDGSSPMSENTYAYTAISQRTDADVVCIGHWHLDQGVQKVAAGKATGFTHFISVGSLARTSRSRDSIENSRKCALIRFNTETSELQVHQIKLRSLPAAEVFDLEVARREKQHEANYQSFLEQLGSKTDFTFDVEDLIRKSTDDKEAADVCIRLFREVQQ